MHICIESIYVHLYIYIIHACRGSNAVALGTARLYLHSIHPKTSPSPKHKIPCPGQKKQQPEDSHNPIHGWLSSKLRSLFGS